MSFISTSNASSWSSSSSVYLSWMSNLICGERSVCKNLCHFNMSTFVIDNLWWGTGSRGRVLGTPLCRWVHWRRQFQCADRWRLCPPVHGPHHLLLFWTSGCSPTCYWTSKNTNQVVNWCSLTSRRWPVSDVMYATMYAPVKSFGGTAQVAPPLIQWLTEPTFFWCGPKPSVEPKAHFFYLVLQIGCLSLQQNVFARMCRV